MRPRILFDPTPGDGGGHGGTPPGGPGNPGNPAPAGPTPTNPAPVPSPNPNPAPPTQPAPTPTATAPPTVPLTVEEYQRLRAAESQVAEFRRQQEEAAAQAEAQRLKLLADKEGAEKALEQQQAAWQAKLAEAERRANEATQRQLNAEKGRTLAGALAGFAWHEQGAETAQRLLADDFEARIDASGQIVTVEKATGRPASDVIAERLQHPPYTHLIKPANRGGSGAVGNRVVASPGPGGDLLHGETLGHVLLAQEAARRPDRGRRPAIGVDVN